MKTLTDLAKRLSDAVAALVVANPRKAATVILVLAALVVLT